MVRLSSPQVITEVLEAAGSYTLYALVLLSINFLSAASAATPDSDFKDAAQLFEKRDIASCHSAIVMLEKVLEQKADHVDSQAMIAFAYAHEAFVLTQLGEKATEYQNSAEAFSKAVLSQQPQNSFARKASLLLQLMAGNHIDVRKTLEKDVTDKETDADLWYMLAVVSEGEAVNRALSKLFTLNANYVWAYSDMAFRAIKLNDLMVAEKWTNVLDRARPGVPETDLLRATIAAQKKDKKMAESYWSAFAKKAPDFPLVHKLTGKAVKKPSTQRQGRTGISF